MTMRGSALSKPRLLATHALFAPARELLDAHADVEYWDRPDRPTRAEVLERVADKEALVCLLTERVEEELLSAAPDLRIVANVAVGFDNIDVDACTRRGVVVTNTPGVLDETTADFAWTLIMAVARRLTEGDRLVRSGAWRGWNLDQLCGGDVHRKTLGLIGFGRIGRAVARRAAGFRMRVLYSSVTRAPAEVEEALGARYATREQLLAESDFISLHVPLMPETRHLIGAPELEAMKPTAYVINTSRGPVLDEAALVHALERRSIAGAGLDVYEREPAVHPGLLGRDDVVLAPHIASASIETRTRMAMMAAENCVALFTGGRTPPNALNDEALGVASES